MAWSWAKLIASLCMIAYNRVLNMERVQSPQMVWQMAHRLVLAVGQGWVWLSGWNCALQKDGVALGLPD
eukprot:6940197-Ditylum_brightwellii.AAC.1